MIETALGANLPVGIVLFDLDDFKHVNDRFGHRAGDGVLVEVASRLRMLAGTATPARLGGDEFVILLIDDVAAVTTIPGAIHDAIAVPFAVAGTTVMVRAACGAAVAKPGDDPISVLAAADAFMYEAKRHQTERRPSSLDEPAPVPTERYTAH